MNKIVSRKTKNICYLGIGIALYVVLGMSVKIPLIGHIQTDLGYAAFGSYLSIFGTLGTIVGACGCVIESLVYNSWFPIGWLFGQIFIGIFCGIVFKATKKIYNSKAKIFIYIITSIVALFIGVGIIKTIIECYLYSIPFGVKFVKNSIAFLADTPPMVVGVLIGNKIKNNL